MVSLGDEWSLSMQHYMAATTSLQPSSGSQTGQKTWLFHLSAVISQEDLPGEAGKVFTRWGNTHQDISQGQELSSYYRVSR